MRSVLNRAVIAALHHEDIQKAGTLLRSLQLERQIEKFEKNNLDTAVNVLYIHQKEEGKSKGKIAIFRRSNGNITQSKVVNLLLITDGKKSYYTAIKSLSRLLTRENANSKRAYHYCINCLQTFCTKKSQDKHYGNCIDHKAVQIEMPEREKKTSLFSTTMVRSSSRYHLSCMQILRAS